jgi:hypothetical protein
VSGAFSKTLHVAAAAVTLAGAMLGLALIALYLVSLLVGFLAALVFRLGAGVLEAYRRYART